MTTKTMLKKMRLTDSAVFERIAQAVAKAESKTSGEIALALTAESSDYSFWELLFSVTVGAFSIAAMLPFSSVILRTLNSVFWGDAAWRLPAFFGITGFGIIAIAFALANIPALDRKIIPHRVRARAVMNRALRQFAESGVYATQHHSGILIFVSYMEREVRIVADTGIGEKISPDLWNLIADDLAAGIAEKTTPEAAFIRAIERCGELLEQHFHAEAENPNELGNSLVILEDGEW